MILGKQLPFLRWSFIRLGLGMNHLLKQWQVGDGREEACAKYVLTHSRRGDIDGVIRAIDEYAYRKKFLINVGDVKGKILDAALKRANARKVLELGAYVGYSALRIARMLPPGGHVYSIEFNPANAQISRRIIAHAGAQDRVTVITGYLGDGGPTMGRLKRKLNPGELDLVFVDHAKDAYVPDLNRILEASLLHHGSIVVADNIRFPGAPEYKTYMESQEGKLWRTLSHETHAEYQTLFKDIVMESTLIG
jgi:catechol O-methyltransferase